MDEPSIARTAPPRSAIPLGVATRVSLASCIGATALVVACSGGPSVGASPSEAAGSAEPTPASDQSEPPAEEEARARTHPRPAIHPGDDQTAPRVGEIRWDARAVPEELPDFPVSAVWSGQHRIIEDVIFTEIDGVVEVGFFLVAHTGCATRWAYDEGVTVRLSRPPIDAGRRFDRIEEEPMVAAYDRADQMPDMTGAASVHFPGATPGRHITMLAGAVSLVVEEVSTETMRGRLYVAAGRRRDVPGRSLLVGGFEARRCARITVPGLP